MSVSDALQLPPGVNFAILDEYARRRELERRRAYYANHPKQIEKQRIRTYTNFLNRHGQLVIQTPPAPPWNDVQAKCLLHMLRCALEQQGEGAERAQAE